MNEIEQIAKGPVLEFNRSFKIILAAVIILQLFSMIISFHYGSTDDDFSTEYFFIQEIGGTIWFILLYLIILRDLRLHNIALKDILNISIKQFIRWIPAITKYCFICGFIVIGISMLGIGSDSSFDFNNMTLLVTTAITTVILAPVFEEIAFRGYLYTSMLQKFKRTKERLVVNAMLFAAAHVFVFAFFLGADIPYYIFFIGYFLAKLYDESRSVLPGIVLHSFNNALVFALDICKAPVYTHSI